MSTETASLVIKVDSSGAKRATGDLDKLTRASGEAEGRVGLLTGAWKGLMAVAASAALAKSVGIYIRLADESANLASKLKLVTGSTEAATKAQSDLFKLSQATSSDLSATTDLYVKLGQSSKDLAGNHKLLLGITEKVSKALVISGADAASSAAVIRQFSQAMAAGALRGDEFVSVMEGAPRLARAIADGMGVAVGSLRTLAAEGKLTSDTIIKALENQGIVLDREFGNMPLTVGRATQQVRNALLDLIGDTEKTSGATSGLAEAIQGLATAISDPNFKAGFSELVTGATNTAAAFALLASKASSAFRAAQEWLNFQAGGNRQMGGEHLAEQRRELAKIEDELAAIRASDQVNQKIEEGRGRVRALENRRRDVLRAIDTNEMLFGDPSKPDVRMIDNGQALPESVLSPKSTKPNPCPNPSGTINKAREEESRATEALANAYKSYNDQLHRGIELHSQTTELARLNYEIQYGALKGISDAQADILREQAKWRDWQQEMADIESVWADATRERTDRMIAESAKATDSMTEFAKQAGQNIQSYLGQSVYDILDGKFSDIGDSFVNMLKRITAELATSKLLEMLGSSLSNYGGQGKFGDFLRGIGGSMGGGPKAAGGPLMAGQGYIVGDGGRPELFVPNQSGTLYPMNRSSGGGGIQVVINNSAGVKVQAREERQSGGSGPDIRKLVIDVIADNLANGGAAWQAVKQRGGLREAV